MFIYHKVIEIGNYMVKLISLRSYIHDIDEEHNYLTKLNFEI